MKTSDSIVKIAPALLAAQKLMGGAAKGAANPYFKSKYADYSSVLEACKDLLNQNGITILQPHSSLRDVDGKPVGAKVVQTILLHESGEWISSETEIVCAKQNDPQAQGSAITYARRYGLQSILSMPTEDDDGEFAMQRSSAAFAGITVKAPRTESVITAGNAPKENVTAASAPAATPSPDAKASSSSPTKPRSFKLQPKPPTANPAIITPKELSSVNTGDDI